MQTVVIVRCHEPIGRDPDYRQPWSDVSIAFEGPPPHGRRELEPTLISRPSLERDIWIQGKLRDEDRANRNEDIEMSQRAMRALESGEAFHIEVQSPDDVLPVVYTSYEYIDRAEAERLLSIYLATLGVMEPQYEWIPPPFVAHPM